MKKSSWVWAAGLLALGTGTALWWNQRQAASAPSYRTAAVERGALQASVSASGTVNPVSQVSVGTQVSGQVRAVHVDFNTEVRAGQLIAEIDPESIEHRVRSAQADLDAANAAVLSAQANAAAGRAQVSRAQSELAEAERIHERNQQLVARGFVAQSEADRSAAAANSAREGLKATQAQLAVAQAQIQSAQASVAQRTSALAQARVDLSRTRILSPVNGIVIKRSVEVGQTVAASFTAPVLFVIAEDLRKMDLVVAVAESDIGRVAAGQQASFTVDAWPTRTYHATVRRVAYGSVITNNIVTYNVELGVENSDLSLRPGMTATADIAVARATQVLYLSNAALRFDPESVLEFLNKTAPKRTLVQALSPRSGRRWSQSPTIQKPAERDKATSVWYLRDGEPVECPVSVGLTNGRITEVSGEGLREGLPVIIGAAPPATP